MNGLNGAVPASVALGCYIATLVITFSVNIPLDNGLGRAASAGEAAAGRDSFER